MPRRSHASRFYHPKNIGWRYRYALCSFLHSPVTSFPLGPNILLNTLFSNTLSQSSPLHCERPSFTPTQNNKQNYSIF
jgi:hypothetical protein